MASKTILYDLHKALQDHNHYSWINANKPTEYSQWRLTEASRAVFELAAQLGLGVKLTDFALEDSGQSYFYAGVPGLEELPFTEADLEKAIAVQNCWSMILTWCTPYEFSYEDSAYHSNTAYRLVLDVADQMDRELEVGIDEVRVVRVAAKGDK